MCSHYENTLVKHIREAFAYFFVNVVVVVRCRVVINVRLLSFRYLMIINAQCTYFVPFEMNCFCECVCLRSQSVADFTMQYPKFYCTQYHTTNCSPCESVSAFFGALLVSTSKFLRVFHTSQQLLAGFQALKSTKEKSSKV